MKKVLIIVCCALFAAICCAGTYVRADEVVAVGGTAVNSSAAAMALVDGDTGELIYSKNCDARREPASTTKICTAITVLENQTILDIPMPIPNQAVGVQASSVYEQKGDLLTVRLNLLTLKQISAASRPWSLASSS
ncbi:MAG: hypothetical protein K2I75_02880, partial [Clostridiales bacterium]|nr:hypothetical protein [Clostridiales bacterium]